MSSPASRGDLVAALVELRDASTALLDDLERGPQPPVERWVAFADLISKVVLLCRRVVLGGNAEDGPCAQR